MVDELPMFQHLAQFELHHGKGCLKYARRVLAAGAKSFVLPCFLSKKQAVCNAYSSAPCDFEQVLLMGP